MRFFILIVIFFNASYFFSQEGKNIDLANSEIIIISQPGEKTLANEDFTKILSILDSAVSEYNHSPIYGSIEGSYFIQIKILDTNQFFVNCLCELTSQEKVLWKDKIIKVLDGGSCYFRTLIDVKNYEYKRFHVNY